MSSRRYSKDTTMNAKRHKIAAAVLASLCFFSAAAFADKEAEEDLADTRSDARERTEEAINEAVEESLASLEAGNRLDLDIRLIGPKSIKVAARK